MRIYVGNDARRRDQSVTSGSYIAMQKSRSIRLGDWLAVDEENLPCPPSASSFRRPPLRAGRSAGAARAFLRAGAGVAPALGARRDRAASPPSAGRVRTPRQPARAAQRATAPVPRERLTPRPSSRAFVRRLRRS